MAFCSFKESIFFLMSFSLSQLSFRVFVDRHATSLAKQVMTFVQGFRVGIMVRQGETPYHALTFFFGKIIEEKQPLQTLVPLNPIMLTYISTRTFLI